MKLFVIPTPIGNLEDMTYRAVRILNEVDLILAEDTRTSATLLRYYQIKAPMQSHHKFNEHRTVSPIVERIKAGEQIALISDAGTPGISDPGYLLVHECIKHDIEVDCLPGATAFVPALVNSGLPCDKFYFEGFLPPKKGRKTRLEIVAEIRHSTILYESPYRVVKTLTQLAEVCGEDRQVSISREISKMHEETLRGTLRELITHFSTTTPKGEFVVVLEGKSEKKKREKM